MYFLLNSNLSTFAKEEKKKRRPVAGVANLVIGGTIAGKSLESGIPRIAGVRIERHSTSRDKAKKILKGGYLDPDYGGTGASNIYESFKEKSKRYVHMTGVHSKDTRIPPNPILHSVQRKFQGGMYRGIQGVDVQSGTEKQRMTRVLKNIPTGLLGLKGRTMFIPGTDKYFDQFEIDPDDIALKSRVKVPVYGNRFSATAAEIKKTGLSNLMKANPKRVAAGAAILGVGGTIGGAIAKKGFEQTFGDVKVKDFFRKGKKVKGYTRKRNKK